jgi:hypothetical protein
MNEFMQNQNQWYVQVSGQSYGPYSMAQMIAFIGEGRVIAGSLISQDATQGFAMAAGFPAFAGQLAPYASPQVLHQAHAQQQAQAGLTTPQPREALVTQPQVQAQPQPQQPVSQPAQPLTPQPAQAAIQQPAATQSAQATVFLIMAEISSENGMRFLQSLQSFGPAQRIGDTVWLVRAASDIDNLRNALANTLTRQDRLFIMDSFNNRTSWFNIGADMDSRIKELWASIEG